MHAKQLVQYPRSTDSEVRGAASDRVMELVTHVIGNYSVQDLCYAGQMVRKAAVTHSREVGSLGF